MAQRPIFFVKRGDRLMARLKHMFYAWRFADQLGGRVVMMWPRLPAFWHQFDGVDYSPSRIFDLPTFYARGGQDELVFVEGQYGYPEKRRSVRDPEFADERANGFLRESFQGENNVFHEQSAMIFRLRDEPSDPAYMKESLRKIVERLPLDPVLQRSIDLARTRIGAEQYVGLHVRRGDVVEMLKQDLPKLATGELTQDRLALIIGHYIARMALDEYYFPYIEKAIAENKKIVFFSDSPETLSTFTAKFGRKHFVDSSIFKGRLPIQKAYLDFNLLMGAEYIIGTGSNFTTFPADISGGKTFNATAEATLESLEAYLHSAYLANVELTAASRARLRAELEKQFNAKGGRAAVAVVD